MATQAEIAELRIAVPWLQTVYEPPRQPMYGQLGKSEIAYFSGLQTQLQTYIDLFRRLNVQITSLLSEQDSRNFNQKVQTLLTTDRVTVGSLAGPTIVIYQPTKQDIRDAYWSSYLADNTGEFVSDVYDQLPRKRYN